MGKLMDYVLNDEESRKEFIHNEESSIYTAKNEDGEKVVVYLEKGKGMEVETNQDNGWVRVDEYDEDGYRVGEGYNGKWK